MLCAKFRWNYLSGSGGEILQWIFSLFRYRLPLETEVALHLKKTFESTLLKDALCHVCLKLAQIEFWRTRFLNISVIYLDISLFCPLEKGRALYVDTFESIGFMFGWLWSNGSGDEDENVKNLPTDRRIERRTDATDNRRSEKFTLTFSLISWAKMWKKISLDFSFFNHKGNRKIEIAKNHLF